MVDVRLQFDTLATQQRYGEAYELLLQHPVDDSYDPFYYCSMTWVLNQLERYFEAQYYGNKGIKLFPHEGFLYAQLGYAYLRLENNEASYDAYLKALSYDYDEAWVFGDLGSIMMDAQDYDQAIDYFESALLEDPHHIFCLMNVAFCYKEQKQYDLAIEYLERIYHLEQDASSLYELICTCSDAKQYDLAYQYLQKMDHPQYDHWKYMELGLICSKKGLIEEALTHFRQAESIQPNLEVYKMLTSCYHVLESYQEADDYAKLTLSLLKDQLLLSKEEEKYHLYKEMVIYSEALINQEDHLHYIDEAKKFGVEDKFIWEYYAHAYARLERNDISLKYCELYYENFEHNIEFLDFYRWLLQVEKKHDSAITILNELIKMNGMTSSLLQELIINEISVQHFEDALKHSVQLMQIDKEKWEAYYYMAWCYFYLKRFEEGLNAIGMLEEIGYPTSYQNQIDDLKESIYQEIM